MHSQFNLITDSCCDLPKAYLDLHNVGVLHFTYTESGKPDGGLSGVDDLFEKRSAHEFYDAIRAGAKPMTSQPSPAEFESVFRDALATGIPTVYLAFSSGISGCYEGAMAVLGRLKEELGEDIPLYVVDSRLASTAQTLYIIEAIKQRDSGLTAEEMITWAEDALSRVHVVFMVDDLEALARGGRIPSGAAKIGSILGVKPLLSIDLDGKLTMAGIARGRKKAFHRFNDLFQKVHDSELYDDVVCIGNADCPDEVPALIDMLKVSDPGIDVIQTSIGPTIGCHVGPGMMALCFWGPDKRGSSTNGADTLD
ncbi:MAG: DegV family protein [Coriobacteriales bacterium]|nr:DegV family protein [Coriobacteriales bacterium]